ncbi:carbohydrate ABC transporter permease [Chelativorans sp.]|uniref:carbohydrate ABC transporter permease n=1 Tax=Chelativorans sp. TaxID=2203393 RepID=UPI002810C007|nr:carbohydrate ABC transporter permease [Chelativorans sp.]
MSRDATVQVQNPWLDRLVLVLLILMAAMWLIPVIWIVVMSLKPNAVLMRSTAGFLPIPFTLQNFTDLLQVSAVPNWLINSLIVAVAMTLLTLIVSSLAGYAFARLDFPGKRIIFILVLAGLMVPEQAVFIPLHTMFADWGMHNTHVALTMPRVAVPIGVFLMTQFFRAVPRELEEAAELDNASRFTVFWKIMLPLSLPALTTLGLFTFLHAWNDFLWPLVSATETDMYTVTVGLASIQGNFAQTQGLGSVMASAVFASLPVVLIYLIFQRYIVRGVAMGSTR